MFSLGIAQGCSEGAGWRKTEEVFRFFQTVQSAASAIALGDTEVTSAPNRWSAEGTIHPKTPSSTIVPPRHASVSEVVREDLFPGFLRAGKALQFEGLIGLSAACEVHL
jgi:hypothetical protein